MIAHTFIKGFSNYDDAFEYMLRQNKSYMKAGNKEDSVCVVPGWEDNYAVVDDVTAIELGLGYVSSSSSTGWVTNPWA